MNNREIAVAIATLIEDKLGEDIDVLDISEKSSFADYMIVASAASERQLGAFKDQIEDVVYENGGEVKNVEGKKDSGWILLDCGDIIVNIFTKEARGKYTLEKVWGDCEKIILEERNV